MAGLNVCGDHLRDFLRELVDGVELAGGLAALLNSAGVQAVQQGCGDGAFNHVSGHDDQGDTLLGKCGNLGDQCVFACALGLCDGLVLVHGLNLADEVRLVAGHEHDACAFGHLLCSQACQVQLCVTVQAHCVVFAHAGFHAARSVQDQVVQGAEGLHGGVDEVLQVLIVGHVSLHCDCLAASLFNSLDDLVRARCLGAVVHHNVRALSGENLCGVCANAAGGAGNDDGLAGQLCHSFMSLKSRKGAPTFGRFVQSVRGGVSDPCPGRHQRG